MNDKPKYIRMKIENKEQLFDIIANKNNQYSVIEKIDFDDAFLNNIIFDIKINASTKLTNMPIAGHITADFMKICQEFQDLVYSLYAISIYNTSDIRRLKPVEKEKLTLIFKINEGSTNIVADLKELFKILSTMSPKTLLIIGGFVTLTTCAFLWNAHQDRMLAKDKLEIEKEDMSLEHKERLQLMSNYHELAMSNVETFKEQTYKNLQSKKLNVQDISISKANKITQEELEIINENDEEEYELRNITDNFLIKKIERKDNNPNKIYAKIENIKMGKIEAEIPIDLFNKESDRKKIYDKFDNNQELEISVSYRINQNKKYKDVRIVTIHH